MTLKTILSATALVGLMAGTATARDQIRVVGSSTVFPFSTAVAEQFGKTTDFATPVVESTGSGGGLKLFCAGVGTSHPDIANSSRRMKQKEWTQCNENGVTDIVEVIVGFDGIVVANSKDAAEFSVTRGQLWQALAQNGDQPAMWSDIDPSLPVAKIEVLGPPPSSGTRDAFVELVMIEGCEDSDQDEDWCAENGADVREDGAWIDAGENDNLIVSKLAANPNAIGVFGFSFLDQNSDKIKGLEVDDVEPSFENIADGEYPVSRSLFFYLKAAHVGVVPGVAEYAAEFMSEAASGEEGYLVDKGLIPLPEEDHEEVAERIGELDVMSGDEDLH